MQRLNYYQLFCELASRYPDKEIVIEISSFNRFAGKIQSHNIICDFDYCDLEDYARSLPEITHIEYSKLIFHPSNSWVKTIERFAKYYTKPANHTNIIEVWEETQK